MNELYKSITGDNHQFVDGYHDPAVCRECVNPGSLADSTPNTIPCPECKGTGYTVNPTFTCFVCHGTGTIEPTEPDPNYHPMGSIDGMDMPDNHYVDPITKKWREPSMPSGEKSIMELINERNEQRQIEEIERNGNMLYGEDSPDTTDSKEPNPFNGVLEEAKAAVYPQGLQSESFVDYPHPPDKHQRELEQIANDLINAWPGYTGIYGDMSGREQSLVKKRTEALAGIEAIIARTNRESRIEGMRQAREVVLRRTEIPKGARNPTRDAVVILGEEIADFINQDIAALESQTNNGDTHE